MTTAAEELLCLAHEAAVEAEFGDPIVGAAVILAEALARLTEEMPKLRRIANGSDD